MEKKEIKQWLKNRIKYREKIVNYNDNIAYYRDCLSSREKLIELVRTEEENLGVQKSRSNTAPQEVTLKLELLGRKEAEAELKRNMDLRNSIYRKMYLLDIAFTYLEKINKEWLYVVECKFIDNFNWNDTEINFNKEFRSDKPIQYEQLRKKADEGLKEVVDFINSVPPNKVNYFHKFNKEYFSVSINYEEKEFSNVKIKEAN